MSLLSQSHSHLINQILVSKNRSFAFVGEPDIWVRLNDLVIPHGLAVHLDFLAFSPLERLEDYQFANFISSKIHLQLTASDFYTALQPLTLTAESKHSLFHLSTWLDELFDNLPSNIKLILSLVHYDLLCNLVHPDTLGWIRGITTFYPNMITCHYYAHLPDAFSEFVKNTQIVQLTNSDVSFKNNAKES